jgi:WD40 repeat protein
MLVKLDLKTDALSTISVPAEVDFLALGDPDRLFAGSTDGTLTLIDTVGETVKPVLFGQSTKSRPGDVFVYDRLRKQMFSVVTGYAPGELQRWTFDPVMLTLVRSQVRVAGGYSRALAISPDFSRVAFKGSVNDGPYTVLDYSPTDLQVTRGSWNAGEHATLAAFSPDSNRFVAVELTNTIVAFESSTHIETGRAGGSFCPYVVGITWSRSSKYVFAAASCSSDLPSPPDSGRLSWFRAPQLGSAQY